MTTTKIDLSRPVEAVCKRTGRVVPLGMAKPYRPSYAEPGERFIQTTRSPCQFTSNETWYDDGRDYCHLDAWTLRNVADTVTVGTTLVTGGMGTFQGKVIAILPDNGCVVEHTTGRLYRLNASLVDTDGDQWRKHEPETKVYINVYADGTVGSTRHKSQDEAALRSKYGKTRVGIPRQTLRGGVIVDALMQATTPVMRSASNPSGINPFRA